MNSFGRIFRVSIYGESHGEEVGIILDGCPAGLPLDVENFAEDLARRRGGVKGTTPRVEDDIPIMRSGLFKGKTTGAPLHISFINANTRSADYDKQREIPRPGHADWVAGQKFGGFEDYRGGGHFSGRLTTCLTAAGVVAKLLCKHAEHTVEPITIQAELKQINGEADIEKGLQQAINAKDSVGGIVECTVLNLAAGLGQPFFDSVESLISHAVFSIPAIKGIEFGSGFAAAKMFGSQHNDVIIDSSGTTKTNHAGGIVGGLTNGNALVFRVAVKPTSSTPQVQQSLNTATGQVENFSVKGRHDLCIALRVPVVLEAVTALVLADLLMVENKIPKIIKS